MNKASGGLKVYAILLHLYPKSHQTQYGKQMQQTVADMLDDTSSRLERTVVWARIITDLPVSACQEHIQVIGENMSAQSRQIKIATVVSIVATLAGASFLLWNLIASTASSSDNTQITTPLNGLLLPGLALANAGIAFFTLKVVSRQKKISVRHFRVIAIIGGMASMILTIAFIDLVA